MLPCLLRDLRVSTEVPQQTRPICLRRNSRLSSVGAGLALGDALLAALGAGFVLLDGDDTSLLASGRACEPSHDGGSLAVVGGDGVCVHVEGERCFGMAQAVLHRLDVDAVAQELRRLGVPELVHDEVGEADLVSEALLAGLAPPGADHGGDVDKLKEAEPWLFGPGVAKGGAGSTGLPNAGAATDSDKQLRHFYEVAGVADDKKD